MAVTKSFKLAELIRHIEYDSTNDIISTTKSVGDKNKKRDAVTKTATTQFSLDTGAKTEEMSAIKSCVNCLCWTKPEFDLSKYFTPQGFCWLQII